MYFMSVLLLNFPIKYDTIIMLGSDDWVATFLGKSCCPCFINLHFNVNTIIIMFLYKKDYILSLIIFHMCL